MAASKARKQKMVEMDQTRAARMPEGTKKKGPQVENLLTKAQKQIDEDRDDVKHMN